MRNITVWCLTLLFFIACNRRAAEEKEEAAFWNQAVITPANEVLYKTEKLPPALKLFDSLLSRTGRSSAYIEGSRYGMMANYHLFFTRNNDSIALYIDSALSRYPGAALQEQYPRTYVGLLIFGGEINFRLGNYAKSNQYFFSAKQLADQYLDPCERSSFTYNAAMVSYRQENFAQSAAYFTEAYNSQATCPVQTTAIALQQQEIQSNIGLCLLQLREYDSADLHFQKALEIANQYHDSLGPVALGKIRGVIAGHRAKVKLAKDSLSEAVALYRESIALNSRPGYELTHALQMQVDLASVYHRMKLHPEMHATLLSIRKGLDSLPDLQTELGWRRLMANYYQDTGAPLSELFYLKRYHALQDSLNETRKQLVQADISRQLKEKEQALQIAVLTRNNERNTIYLWVTVLLSAMAGLIIFLVYQNYRRSKKNISVLTHLNTEISLKKTALENANEEKDRILHVVAHDLRNPIGSVAYISDLVMMGDHNEKDQALLVMIKDASQQALALTNELLGLRSTAEDQPIKQKVDLAELVRGGVSLYRYKAAEKGQQIHFEETSGAIFVNADAAKLNRVLNNLLANAIKFSPLDEDIMVRVEKLAGGALLTVTDKGIGIPEHQQHAVFDRFTSARRQGTEGERSFGLGLSICKEILEREGGSIRLRSTEGQGTSVEVRLDLANDAQFLS